MTLYYGAKFSKKDHDADSTDYDNLTFTTAAGSRSIKRKGIISITTDDTGNWCEETVKHNFKYKPQFEAFAEDHSGRYVRVPGTYMTDCNGKDWCYTICGSMGGYPYARLITMFQAKVTNHEIIFGAKFFCYCNNQAPWPMTVESWHYAEETFDIEYIIFMEEVELP